MNITTCRSCGARIFYAATVNGKDMPMDEKPVGKASVLKVNPADATKPMVKIVDAYQTHFISCPNRDRHRKKAPASTRDKEQPHATDGDNDPHSMLTDGDPAEP